MREMKDSDIEWLGDIPVNWSIRSLKRVLSTSITDGPHETPILYDEGIPFVSAESVKDGIINLDYKRGYISLEDHEIFQRKVSPKKGDIFIVKSGATTGNVGLVITDQVFDIWSPLALVRGDSSAVEQEFLYYQLLSNIFRVQVEQGWSYGTQQNISMKALGNTKVMVPPLEEQKAIVKYLHNKCDQIDTIIAKEQSVIEKLQEYKKAIITETIIKGLNDSVERQNQGAVWFYGVPISWTFSELRYVTRDIFDIDHWMPESRDEGIPYLMTGDLESRTSYIDFSKTKKISIEDFNRLARNKYPCHHDIIMARYASIGNCTYVDTSNQFLVSYSCLTIRPNIDEILPMFMYYYFESYAFEEECKVYIKSNTQGNIGKDNLRRIKLVYPNIGEQALIVKYLDTKCANIDAVILKKHSLIDKLTEYKKSLIYEVVTGKKEVSHV